MVWLVMNNHHLSANDLIGDEYSLSMPANDLIGDE